MTHPRWAGITTEISAWSSRQPPNHGVRDGAGIGPDRLSHQLPTRCVGRSDGQDTGTSQSLRLSAADARRQCFFDDFTNVIVLLATVEVPEMTVRRTPSL